MNKYLSTIGIFIVVLLTIFALYLLLMGKIIEIPYGTKEGGLMLSIGGIILFFIGLTLIRLIKIIEKRFLK
jgi:hypothetical protein